MRLQASCHSCSGNVGGNGDDISSDIMMVVVVVMVAMVMLVVSYLFNLIFYMPILEKNK